MSNRRAHLQLEQVVFAIIEVLGELSQARCELVYLLTAVGGLHNLGAQLLLHL